MAVGSIEGIGCNKDTSAVCSAFNDSRIEPAQQIVVSPVRTVGEPRCPRRNHRFIAANPATDDIIIRMTPEHWHSADFGKDGN